MWQEQPTANILQEITHLIIGKQTHQPSLLHTLRTLPSISATSGHPKQTTQLKRFTSKDGQYASRNTSKEIYIARNKHSDVYNPGEAARGSASVMNLGV